jgi:hypothetical protein
MSPVNMEFGSYRPATPARPYAGNQVRIGGPKQLSLACQHSILCAYILPCAADIRIPLFPLAMYGSGSRTHFIQPSLLISGTGPYGEISTRYSMLVLGRLSFSRRLIRQSTVKRNVRLVNHTSRCQRRYMLQPKVTTSFAVYLHPHPGPCQRTCFFNKRSGPP